MKKFLTIVLLLSGLASVAQKLDKRFTTAPIFDRNFYLKTHLDVATSGIDPLKHWTENGIKEGRASSPVFDAKYYLNRYDDLKSQFGDDYSKAITHFLDFGMKEGRQACATFDAKYYAEANPDLYKTFGMQYDKLINHYLTMGIRENRRTANNDRDDDGVANETDKCPDQPGPVANNGCPEAKKSSFTSAIVKQIENKLSMTAKSIQFETGKATLMPASNKVLSDLHAFMKKYPEARFSIGGHTDNVGNADANMKLSNARAYVVKDWLVRKGIERFRIEAKGFGDTQPIDNNATPAGRAKNRRTEMKLIL